MSKAIIGSLGAFDLGEVVGRGATAHVRQGWHRASGEPVAVKVFDRGRPNREAFERELRVQASLVHRDILMVLDGGFSDLQSGQIPAGTPYMVLEWASGGAAEPPTAWEGVRRLLVACLSGLARAHASGVVHRDIKLGNLLRCTSADRRPGYKLADFGIALSAGSRANRAGTPANMAPEQIEGHGHEIGPWTDLYSVGCLAFRLATGRPAVKTTNLDATLCAHLLGRTEPYVPIMAVPPGLEAWIRDLRRVNPFGRPSCAADALGALEGLDGLVSRGRHRDAVPLPRGLAAAGRRLAGLRLGPALGREDPLATLDGCVAVEDGEVRLVWVRGPRGVGRTHLVRSFAASVSEEGRGDVCTLEGDWLSTALGHPPRDGVEELLARRFPLAEPIHRRDIGWLWADPPQTLPANALRRFAEARSGRPLVVVVDDAPGRIDALAQVTALFATPLQGGAGVLVVVTAADDVSRGEWRALPAHQVVSLKPLPAAIVETILIEHLGMSVREAAAGAAAAGGLPKEGITASSKSTETIAIDDGRRELLAIASVLQSAGTVDVEQWVASTEALAPQALDLLPALLDELLDGGLAQAVGNNVRIDLAVLGVPVAESVLLEVSSQMLPGARVRALALHGRPDLALDAAEERVAAYGADIDPLLLNGVAHAASVLEGDAEARARIMMARLLVTRGDTCAAAEEIDRCRTLLQGSPLGTILIAQREMHSALFTGRFDDVVRQFESHAHLLTDHPLVASMSWLSLSLVPRTEVAGMPRSRAALTAENLASKAGQQSVKIEARRVLAEIAEEEGRHDDAMAWVRAGRSAARSFCLPLLGVILAEARFSLNRGDRDGCRACLDELDAVPETGLRPSVLGVLQRAELAISEGDWAAAGRAADRSLRLARDVEWVMVEWASEALAAGGYGEERRWDAAEKSVDAATLLAQHEERLPSIAASLDHLVGCAEAHGQEGLAVRAMVASSQHGR